MEKTICQFGSLKFGTAKNLKEGEWHYDQWYCQMVFSILPEHKVLCDLG